METNDSIIDDINFTEFVNENKKEKISKICFSITAFLSFLFVLLYFVLPVFKSDNLKVTNSFFSKEDIVSLAEIEHQSNLFVDCQKAEKTLNSKASFIIRNNDFKTDGFTLSCDIEYEKKVGIFSDIVYFSNGLTKNEIEEDVSSLNLEKSESLRLLNIIKEDTSLPVVLLPKNIENNADNIKTACDCLFDISDESLSEIALINFLNKKADSRWDNIIDFIVEKDGYVLLYKNVLVSFFDIIFNSKNFADVLNESLIYSKSHQEMKKIDEDYLEYGEVFKFTFSINEEEKVTLNTYEG